MAFISKEKEFILLIGQGLSAFGRVEMALAELFIVAMQCADPKSAKRVFWAVNSLEVRTAMTSAALKTALSSVGGDGGLQRAWTEIAKELPKLASKRAELAHGNWVGMAWLSKKREQKVDQFFAPYWGKASSELQRDGEPGHDPRPPKRLYKPDIEERKLQFSALEFQIRALRAHLEYWQLSEDQRTAIARHPQERADRPSTTPKTRGTSPRPKPAE